MFTRLHTLPSDGVLHILQSGCFNGREMASLHLHVNCVNLNLVSCSPRRSRNIVGRRSRVPLFSRQTYDNRYDYALAKSDLHVSSAALFRCRAFHLAKTSGDWLCSSLSVSEAKEIADSFQVNFEKDFDSP